MIYDVCRTRDESNDDAFIRSSLDYFSMASRKRTGRRDTTVLFAIKHKQLETNYFCRGSDQITFDNRKHRLTYTSASNIGEVLAAHELTRNDDSCSTVVEITSESRTDHCVSHLPVRHFFLLANWVATIILLLFSLVLIKRQDGYRLG
jgi:hypothetical protein